MTVSFLIALYLKFVHPYTGLPLLSTGTELCLGVAITTIAWIGVTMITQPVEEKTLRNFYRLVKPGGPGWKRVVKQAQQDNDPVEDENRRWDVPLGILCTAPSLLPATGFTETMCLLLSYQLWR
jgi:hypothetical protein